MTLLGIIAFVAVIYLISQNQSDSHLFDDQPCGYCPMLVHWDRKQHVWVHENGQLWAPLPGIKAVGHNAHPFGIITV